MRWCFALIVAGVIVPPFAAQEDEAEKLLQSTIKKIRDAKTLQCKFDSTFSANTKKMQMKGTLISGANDKARIDVEAKFGNKVSNILIIGDSMKVVFIEGNTRTVNNFDKWFHASSRFAFSSGVALLVTFHTYELFDLKKPPLGAEIRYSDFKLGGKENIGKRTTQRLEYIIERRGGYSGKIQFTIWIDTETGLPAKLVATHADIGTYTETYSEFTIDAKVDEKLFQLPMK